MRLRAGFDAEESSWPPCLCVSVVQFRFFFAGWKACTTMSIRIGNACGFWGHAPDLDYLTLDYLAEVSMSILARQRERRPELGYPADLIEVVRSLAPFWREGRRFRVVTNAGGLNPAGCAAAAADVLCAAGCGGLKVGVVS